jgi:hypothetical protein
MKSITGLRCSESLSELIRRGGMAEQRARKVNVGAAGSSMDRRRGKKDRIEKTAKVLSAACAQGKHRQCYKVKCTCRCHNE